jgi:hypothetical protein
MEMADIAWSDVTGFASELSAVAAGAQTTILAYVNRLAPVNLGGEESARYRFARILLAAHYGTLSLRQGNPPAGPVVSETVDRLSTSYGMVIAAEAQEQLFSTGYGKDYHSLVRRSPGCRAPLVT